MEKTHREIELEKIILKNQIEAIKLKYILENSLLVKSSALEHVENIIENSKQIIKEI